MKCQSLFSSKNKKKIMSLSSAESAHSRVTVQTNVLSLSSADFA